MANRGEPTTVRIGRIIYGGLLLFYPLELRRKFGEEMQEVFVALLSAAIAEGGIVQAAWLWRVALSELLTVALPCRLSSNAAIAGALSFLVSAALFLFFLKAVT